MAEAPPKTAKRKKTPEWTGWAALGTLVAGLAGLVLWSLPHGGADTSTGPVRDASDEVEPWHDEALINGSAGPATGTRTELERPMEASADIALVVDDKADLPERTTRDAIARLLDARYCGSACDAVRRAVLDEKTFDLDRMTTEELGLPSKETWDTVASTLTTDERASLDKRPVALFIRTRGPGAPDHVPARTAFAVAAALAESLGALVYDETLRRIEAPRDVIRRAITAPLGQPVFTQRHVVVQLYRQEDSTARLLTLGMARFGAPDLSLRGAPMADAPDLAVVLNAAAAQVAHGASKLPLRITLDDVARVTGGAPRDLSPEPARAEAVALDAIEPPRTEGDPDNEMAELVPPGGVANGTWGAVLTSLFHRAPAVAFTAMDAELSAVATKARASLPAALKRTDGGAATLFVKAPFPTKGDAGSEWLWIEVQRCDAKTCTGPLTNTPTYATSFVEGRPATVKRAELADVLLRLPDGGTEGGDSIRILEARALGQGSAAPKR